jgi:hypothetical protein
MKFPGRVAGFYVSSDLMGVVTHGGERTHSHWVAMDGRETAHLDSWGIKAGTDVAKAGIASTSSIRGGDTTLACFEGRMVQSLTSEV